MFMSVKINVKHFDDISGSVYAVRNGIQNIASSIISMDRHNHNDNKKTIKKFVIASVEHNRKEPIQELVTLLHISTNRTD